MYPSGLVFVLSSLNLAQKNCQVLFPLIYANQLKSCQESETCTHLNLSYILEKCHVCRPRISNSWEIHGSRCLFSLSPSLRIGLLHSPYAHIKNGRDSITLNLLEPSEKSLGIWK